MQLANAPKSAFLAPLFPEFDHIYAEQFKHKAGELKKSRAGIRAKQACCCVVLDIVSRPS